jgi:2OG-Fe(II) oxygenase superfamily
MPLALPVPDRPRGAVRSWDHGSLGEEFKRCQCAVLKGMLDGAQLARVLHELDEEGFEGRRGIGQTELCLDRGKGPALLFFLCNDPALFEFVRAITGCDRIGSFAGRIYRMLPASEHEGRWHDDNIDDRMVAMSLNLSPSPFAGGVLEIRDRHSRRILQRVANNGPGDALLFRVGPSLEHRVTPVNGEVPKTAYAGWFKSGSESALLHPAEFLA